MKESELLCLLDVGLLLMLLELLPLLAEPFGDLRIVDIWLNLDYFLPLVM